MNRLILFSGGVESMALLLVADHDDTVLMVEPFHGPGITFFDREKALKAAKLKGVTVKSASIKIPLQSQPAVRPLQIHMLSALASVYVNTYANIREVLWGRHMDDVRQDQKYPLKKIEESWKVAHPHVSLSWPLLHMSKREIWDSIPPEFQALTHSCIHAVPCGECGKCKERIKHGIPVNSEEVVWN